MQSLRTLVAVPSIALALSACGGEPTTQQSVGVAPQATALAAAAASTASSDSPASGPGAPEPQAAGDPAEAAKAMLVEFRAGRISGFLRRAMPADGLATMKSSWDEKRSERVTASDEAQFQEFMGMLLADDAEDTLFGMVQPHLEEAQEQLGAMTMMLPMLAAGAMEGTVDPAQAAPMIGAVGEKLAGLNIASEENARLAIREVISMAEALELSSAADIQKLDFDAMLSKLDVVYGGVTGVLSVYGLSFEKALESMQLETLSVEGNTASMQLTVELFGGPPQTIPFELENENGRWIIAADESAPAARGPRRRMAR